ncbi:Lon-like ATP-dependent protease [Caloramator quimbayensis]|uniref:endopeptidase La n=1 Tax=Caloramator quimbayensis TaxID=1147123 RepID=A0A1T4X137_9CLOT|nr:ATP-binding protein [Caloramator quimbayensis]SKA83363.1 Lon-like ATP-dependent protease [Caloramator quimbayensis]
MKYKKLTSDDLKMDFSSLPIFESSKEITPFKEIIGQQRAVDAIEVGLLMNKKGYNIYVSGNNGCGKRSYVIKRIKEYAKKMPAPLDWCYVYNFKDNNIPLAIWLKSGTSVKFKDDVSNLIDSLFYEVPDFFSNEDYEKKRNDIIDIYQKEILKYVDKLYDIAKYKGFNVKSTGEGFAFIPLINGTDEMTERQYNELSEDEKNKINEDVSELKIIALEAIRKSKQLKKEMKDKLKKLDDDACIELIGSKIDDLIKEYGYNPKITDYLKDMQKDITENIDAFMDGDEANEKYDEEFYKRYYVNVIVSHDKNEGAPVIFEDEPEFHNLIGIIEYENKQGMMVTDFTMIKAGSLHKANGGFIVIDALKLLSSYKGWNALKNSLISNYISIENLKNQFDIIPLSTLEPENIPLDIKVILLGTPFIYYLLFNYDEEFRELFKIKADFEDEIKNNNGEILKFLGFISNYCDENNVLPISRDGIIEIIKYSSRIAESRNYLTASFDKIVDIIDLADSNAKLNSQKNITKINVGSAISSMEKRHGIIRDKLLNMYKEGKYIINLEGLKVGEINGLAVIDYGDFAFGKQNRITVTTFAGRNGIINIERETKMSGNIHSKGVLILSGYIGETFGQDIPISFNANICFEQMYGEIDGDSASSAELIALISSLSDIPIKQNIAVTGSVNQRGEIQPVGKVNEKIEGFYDICKIYGIKNCGVIIPYSNIDELVLKDAVIEAVDKEEFSIYAVKDIEECMEIMTDESLKSDDKVFELIKNRIKEKMIKYQNAFTADRQKKKSH